MPRPGNKGTRLTHVGLALGSIDVLLPLFRDVLQMSEVQIADSDGARIAAVASGESIVELLEPAEDNSPIARFVNKRGPGIHHICLSVDDLDSSLERCSAAGIRLIDSSPRLGAEGKRIAFLHPGSTGGILIELSEY